MKKLTILLMILVSSVALAQTDDRDFQAYLYNDDYEVFMRINFYDSNITIPEQPLYGELPGFLGKKRNSFCWIITSAKIKNGVAELSLINDYGSEDLTAQLSRQNDSIYVLKQLDGSALKVPKDGKWQKLPKALELKRRR